MVGGGVFFLAARGGACYVCVRLSDGDLAVGASLEASWIQSDCQVQLYSGNVLVGT